MGLHPRIRLKIVRLREKGLSYVKIKEALAEEDNCRCCTKTISRICKKYKNTGLVMDEPRCGRPRRLDDVHRKLIDFKMKIDDETSAAELQNDIEENGVTVCRSTINRERRRMGWIYGKTRFCPMVREANKQKRLKFCTEGQKNDENFDNVIFSDESSVMIEAYTPMCFRKRGLARKLKARPKHPLKVHVWAGISKQGATGICIFSGIMDSAAYQTILQDTLLPFITERYPHGHRFMQDNDPKHTSRSTRQWLEDNGVNHWPTPPESPDLNPIEKMWAKMKWFIRRTVKPRTKEQLVAGILRFWKTVDRTSCCRLIGGLGQVMQSVIKRNGSATEH